MHTQILLASIQCRRKTSHRRCANQGEASGKRDNVIFMGQRDIQQRFDRAADTFDAVDFVHETTRSGLMERLAPMTIEARTIVDLGSATGSSGRLLAKRFKGSMVVSVDLSRRMLEKAARGSWFSRRPVIQADAARLPLADQSVDIVFANLLLPWVEDRLAVFAEAARVLRKDGLLLFSSLGPDTFAGQRGDLFPDMHNVGDELVRSGLRDPVLDVDRLNVSWKDPRSRERDLADMGAGDWLPAAAETLDLEFELIYGHSWGPGERLSPGAVKVDIASIGRRKR